MRRIGHRTYRAIKVAEIRTPYKQGEPRMRNVHAACPAVLCAVAMLSPAGASAQDAERWQFTGSLNLFMPSISGKTVFPPPADGGSSVNLDSEQILEALQFTVMGSLEARKGRWGAFTDVVYINLGTNKDSTRSIGIGGSGLPVDVRADVNYDIEGWSWTLGGAWRAVQQPDLSLDLIAGARLLDINQKLDYTLTGNVGSIPLPDQSGARKSSLSNWDAVVGVKGRYRFGDSRKWFMPYYLDVGTGNSNYTTQAMAGVGYTFGWGEVVGAWRYLGYDMKSGQPLKDLSFSGPMVSAVFHW